MLASISLGALGLADPESDEDLSTRIRRFLGTLRLAAVRSIEVEASSGLVTVEGTVGSFYERQLAIACIQRVAGVRQVIDRIRVCDGSLRSAARSSHFDEALP